MALQKLVLRPGVNKEGTNYSNEDGFYYSDKVRFRSGYAEKIGGWVNTNFDVTYKGTARALWNWVTLSGENLLAVGTTQKFYIQGGIGGTYNDITPIRTIGTIGPGVVFTPDGVGQYGVTVTDNNAALLTPGTFVRFTPAYAQLNADITSLSTTITIKNVFGTTFTPPNSVYIDQELIAFTGVTGPVSGVYTLTGCTRGAAGTVAAPHFANAYVLSGSGIAVGGQNVASEFEIIAINSSTSYTIRLPNTATVGTSLSGTFYAFYFINAGGATTSYTSGWGAAQWGQSGWGSGASVTEVIPFRLWSVTNFDENLLFAPREGSIYWWTKSVPTYARATTLNEYANTGIKTTATANWSLGASSITVSKTDGINTGAFVTGAGIPAGAYVATTWDFSTLVPLVTAPGVPAITTAGGTNAIVSFSYAGKHIPVKTLVVATSSQNAFTIALGATPYNPITFSDKANFDPLLVRWSDQDNPSEWVPEVTNQSGEQRLSNGSTIVATSFNRQEILIWTDTALYSMQYLGPPYVFGINLLMDNISIASQNSVITVNNVTYWMGVDKFYSYSGRVDTLVCSLRAFVFNRLNKNQIQQVCCGTNEAFNEVWWFYPSGSSTVNDSYVVYNHVENLWYYGTLKRTAWLDTQLRKYPLAAFSTQVAFLSDNIGTTPATGATIAISNTDGYPNSGVVIIDSEQIAYTGVSGSSLTGCTRGYNGTPITVHLKYAYVSYYEANCLLNHELGYDDKTINTPRPIEAYIQSSDFDIGDGMNFAYIWRILPDLSFSGSTVTNPIVYLTVKVRQNSGTDYVTHPLNINQDNIGVALDNTATPTTNTTVEQFSQLNADGTIYPINNLNRGQVYTRVRGRQMAFQMRSTDLGVFWQMGLMRIDLRQDGRR